MRRKVARIGPSTLMISLPSKWVKQQHIEKGHELHVEEKENSLIIHPSETPKTEKTEIHLKKKGEFLKRYLRSLYHRGYTEIKITSEEGLDFDEIKKELDMYLGFEIIEQGKKYCIIRNVADAMEQEFDVVLRKIFFMNETMAEESLQMLQTQKHAALREIATIEKTNNKLINLSYRILNKSGKISDHKLMSLYTVLFCLENIADQYRDLCTYSADKKINLTKDLEEFYKLLILHYHMLMNTYYAFDAERMVELRNQRLQLERKAVQIQEKNQQPVFVFHLCSLLQYMKDMELCIGFGH